MVGLEIVSAGKDNFWLACIFTRGHRFEYFCPYTSIFFLFRSDDGFNKKQRHLKAQAFAIKMRPRKETLEVNFVSFSLL